MGAEALTNADLVETVRYSETFRNNLTAHAETVLEAMLKVDRKEFLPDLLVPKDDEHLKKVLDDEYLKKVLDVMRSKDLPVSQPECENSDEEMIRRSFMSLLMDKYQDCFTSVRDLAYLDKPLLLDHSEDNRNLSTCSQPSLVAKVAEHVIANLVGFENPKILELGVGCGYQLALIKQALPAAEVYGIDINPRLVELARRNLTKQFGTEGWQVELGDARNLDHLLMFNVIYLTFGVEFPFDTDYLHEHLKPGGVLIYPQVQGSMYLERKSGGVEVLMSRVQFVPMQ